MRPIDVIRKARKSIWFEWTIGSDWGLYVKNNIPLFSYNVAVCRHWWNKFDRDERIRYFDWLFDKYRDPVGVEYYPVI